MSCPGVILFHPGWKFQPVVPGHHVLGFHVLDFSVCFCAMSWHGIGVVGRHYSTVGWGANPNRFGVRDAGVHCWGSYLTPTYRPGTPSRTSTVGWGANPNRFGVRDAGVHCWGSYLTPTYCPGTPSRTSTVGWGANPNRFGVRDAGVHCWGSYLTPTYRPNPGRQVDCQPGDPY